MNKFIIRVTVERTLEELALYFRQTGRRDATLFWNLVEPKIKELSLAFRSTTATAMQKIKGIPEAQKLRIFDRFAQLGNKDRRGLGLGLYISKTLVESHHGKIWATSKPGEGSIFCFTLPKR